MDLKVEQIKPMHADILIKKCEVDYSRSESSVIELAKDNNGKEEINFFDVIAIGHEVKDVKVGDVILVKFSMHTIPIILDGSTKYAITDEEHVDGILEK